MSRYIRTLPISHLTDSAVPTTGSDFLIPATGIKPRIVRIHTSAAAFVGFGLDDSPPTADPENCVYHPSGQQEYVLDDGTAATYLYVYSVADTLVAYVSFLG